MGMRMKAAFGRNNPYPHISPIPISPLNSLYGGMLPGERTAKDRKAGLC